MKSFLRICKNFRFFFVVILFYICTFDFNNFVQKTSAFESSGVESLLKNDEYVDYVFTAKEINSANITDTSITIKSEYFDSEFLENAVSFNSLSGYTITYENGELKIFGLIPDFLYDSLFVNAMSSDGEKYVLQIKNFKTLKPQNQVDQFIIQTLQHSLKKFIRPIDFYLWQHKILKKEVTPEEFVYKIIQHPKFASEEFVSSEEFIDKMYYAVFLNKAPKEKLASYVSKFHDYKQRFYIRDYDAYRIILGEMLKAEEFKYRIDDLNLEESSVPTFTRYEEVYSDFKKDKKQNVNFKDRFYVMDYDELNMTEVSQTSAKIFLNEGFNDKLNFKNVLRVDIPNAFVDFVDGKIFIGGLEPNTVYENFTITYLCDGIEKKIFVKSLKTMRESNDKSFEENRFDVKYNFLEDFEISCDEFVREFYKDLGEDCVDYFKMLFVTNVEKFKNFLIAIDKFDFGINDEILIVKIYDIVFNRVPDEYGLNYWLNKFRDYQKGNTRFGTIQIVINEMMQSDEFKTIFNDAILKKFEILNNKPKRLQIL